MGVNTPPGLPDETEAVVVTKRLMGYFQGATTPGAAGDQTRLRDMVPERARRAYFVTPIIETWAVDEPPAFPNYEAGTWGPEAAHQLLDRDGRRWRRI